MKVASEIRFSIARLACTQCGAEANASCNCGKPYLPAAQRIKEYDKANPGKSTRAAAADLGISQPMVVKARNSDDNQLSPANVIGLDGKEYRAKKNQKQKTAPVTEEEMPTEAEAHEDWQQALYAS